jgi:hypothetical protein
MSATAFQTMYRQETIAGFERRQSLLRDSVTTEVLVKGNTATFLVADSGGATAVTRGVDGMIPARSNNNNQTAVTLTEWHDLARASGCNVFSSQGDQRQIMQKETQAVINRKIDSDIITELNTGTVNTGTASTASISLVMRAKTILQNADVPADMELFGLITPAFEAYLTQIAAYSSGDFVSVKPMENTNAWEDKKKVRNWLGVKWIVHNGLPGVGTNAEKCFLYHRNALGHAANTSGIDTAVGYDEEQDYSFARATIYMGTQILQDSGVVVINHDGSAFVAA